MLPDAEKTIDWRPMDTAPKDGGPIMLYTINNAIDGRDHIVGAYWHKDAQGWACDPSSRWGVIIGKPILWAPMLVSPADPDASFFESWFKSRLGDGPNGLL